MGLLQGGRGCGGRLIQVTNTAFVWVKNQDFENWSLNTEWPLNTGLLYTGSTVSGIVWEHSVCHRRRVPLYYWAETNYSNSWAGEDINTSSIPHPKQSQQHRKKGKASLLEDICKSGFIHYHRPRRTWASCSSKWRNCCSHWEVCLSAIPNKNKTYEC